MARGNGSEVRRAADGIRNDYNRFGGAPIPKDMGPADILLERIRVMAGYVAWLDAKIQQWPDALVALGQTNVDDKGSMQAFPTEKAAWLHEWHTSNDALVNYVKIALSANIDERRVALAESQASTVVSLLDQVFKEIELTPDQLLLVAQKLPNIIRGEIVARRADDGG